MATPNFNYFRGVDNNNAKSVLCYKGADKLGNIENCFTSGQVLRLAWKRGFTLIHMEKSSNSTPGSPLGRIFWKKGSHMETTSDSRYFYIPDHVYYGR